MSGTSALSSSTGIATATPSATSTCTNLYNPPNQNAVCAMPSTSTYLNYMSSCCGDAQIVSYDDDCGIYCVALDQTISDLIECLMEEGAEEKPQDVFCSGNTTESKTEDGDVPSSAGVSVIATGGSGRGNGDGDGDDDDDEGGSGSGSGTSGSDDSSDTESGTVRSSLSSTAIAAGSILFLCLVVSGL